jgi:hypothetical protein
VWWTYAVFGAAVAGDLVIGLSVGAWLGWPIALLLAMWTGWRLRARPSAEARMWRRQAAMQRRTAAVLRALGADGLLVLHDVTLPGWLDGLDHLVVGPTGVWVIGSWQGRRLRRGGPPPAIVRGLRGQADAVAEVLDGWARIPARPLLCVDSRWPVPPQPSGGRLRVAARRQLADIVLRSGPATPPGDLEQAKGRLLEVLRPAA